MTKTLKDINLECYISENVGEILRELGIDVPDDFDGDIRPISHSYYNLVEQLEEHIKLVVKLIEEHKKS